MANKEFEVTSLPQAEQGSRGMAQLLDSFRKEEAPKPQPAMGFFTDTTICIGCKACEVACKQWNQIPADEMRWTGNSYDNTEALSATSWRHVKFIEQFPETTSRLPLDMAPAAGMPTPGRWLMMSDVCKHCALAPCQQACPTGAIIYNEFQNVYIQPDVCNGCGYCVAACPFGVITRSSVSGHTHKCTLCFDRQRDGLVPACAKACPTASIQFGAVETLRANARKRVETLNTNGTKSAYLYGDASSDTYSELHSFYLLLDQPAVYGLPEKPFNPWLNMPGDYVRSFLSGLAMLAALLLTLLLLGY